jgi:hypothetical protein
MYKSKSCKIREDLQRDGMQLWQASPTLRHDKITCQGRYENNSILDIEKRLERKSDHASPSSAEVKNDKVILPILYVFKAGCSIN